LPATPWPIPTTGSKAAGIPWRSFLCSDRIAQRDVGEEEVTEQSVGGFPVVGPNRIEETSGHAGEEIEDRGRVRTEPDLLVRHGEDLRRRHASNIDQAVAEPVTHRDQLLDFARTVLESNEIRASVHQAFERLDAEDAIVPIVDNDTDIHRPADHTNVAIEAFLLDVEEIVRQHEQPAGARGLSRPRELNGDLGSIPVPAITGTLRSTASTAAAMTRPNSASGREKNSPVPPAAKRPAGSYVRRSVMWPR
jgi:hypothetical protein